MNRVLITDMRHPAAAAIASVMAARGWEIAENGHSDLDALIITPREIARELLAGDMNRVIDCTRANINAAYAAAQEYGLNMARRARGSIVFLSSIHAEKPTGAAPGYAIAQGAVKMMMKELALFYGRYGVRVNMICASPLQGEIADFDSDIVGVTYCAEQKFPLERYVSCDEIGKTAAFLASEESSGLNGAEITVDGGLNLHYFDREFAKL